MTLKTFCKKFFNSIESGCQSIQDSIGDLSEEVKIAREVQKQTSEERIAMRVAQEKERCAEILSKIDMDKIKEGEEKIKKMYEILDERKDYLNNRK